MQKIVDFCPVQMADPETPVSRPGGRLNHLLAKAACYWHSLLTQRLLNLMAFTYVTNRYAVLCIELWLML